MTTKPKTAKLLSKVIDAAKQKDETIRDLRQQFADSQLLHRLAMEQAESALLEALENAAKQLRNEQFLHADTAHRHAKYQTEAEAQRCRLLARISDLEHALVDCRSLLADAKASLADLQPQLDLVASQRAELSTMLDSVRDRLHRREADRERAILNRKVIAGARPEINRR